MFIILGIFLAMFIIETLWATIFTGYKIFKGLISVLFWIMCAFILFLKLGGFI